MFFVHVRVKIIIKHFYLFDFQINDKTCSTPGQAILFEQHQYQHPRMRAISSASKQENT
jgi:hypothetical protein